MLFDARLALVIVLDARGLRLEHLLCLLLHRMRVAQPVHQVFLGVGLGVLLFVCDVSSLQRRT
ncbi:hypothetical protein [Xanthomonas oryzae]|uniref:hypothetical protein n=1 Tax=Xanthomonas oryzae TaxID=347 RepID=UPI00035C6A34|nr:hypothetical protein [Xanthomonas oryzae]